MSTFAAYYCFRNLGARMKHAHPYGPMIGIVTAIVKRIYYSHRWGYLQRQSKSASRHLDQRRMMSNQSTKVDKLPPTATSMLFGKALLHWAALPYARSLATSLGLGSMRPCRDRQRRGMPRQRCCRVLPTRGCARRCSIPATESHGRIPPSLIRSYWFLIKIGFREQPSSSGCPIGAKTSGNRGGWCGIILRQWQGWRLPEIIPFEPDPDNPGVGSVSQLDGSDMREAFGDATAAFDYQQILTFQGL